MAYKQITSIILQLIEPELPILCYTSAMMMKLIYMLIYFKSALSFPSFFSPVILNIACTVT